MKAKAIELMLKSLEVTLSPEEQNYLQEAYHQYPELNNLKSEIMKIRQQLEKMDFQFKESFEEEVMAKIHMLRGEEKSLNYSGYYKAFIRVFWAAAAIILFFFLFVYFREGSLNLELLAGNDLINTDNLSTFLLTSY